MFQSKDEIPEIFLLEPGQTVLEVLVSNSLVNSQSDGRRLIKQNAVRLESMILTDADQAFPGYGVLRVGNTKSLRVKNPYDSLMKATIEGDDLVIRLPLELLIWSQKQREESITVIDKQKMARYLTEHILEFGGDPEIGSTAFEDLIDAFFVDALESAEDWLKGWWEEGDEGEYLAV